MVLQEGIVASEPSSHPFNTITGPSIGIVVDLSEMIKLDYFGVFGNQFWCQINYKINFHVSYCFRVFYWWMNVRYARRQ